MAYTLKSKRLGYDNIAAGAAAGFERVVQGSAAPGDATTKEAIDHFVTSDVGTNTSFIADRPVELENGGWAGSSNSNYVNVPSSDTTPFYTSATSFTTAVGELNTAI